MNVDLVSRILHKSCSHNISPPMKHVSALALALLMITSSGQAQDRLPLKVEILLAKLTEWKANEKAVFDKNVQTKQQQVAVALKAHLKIATQAGDLKTANLIQAKIDELSPKAGSTGSTVAIGEKPMSKTAAKKALEERIIGMTWVGGFFITHFEKRGKAIVSYTTGNKKGDVDAWEWEIVDEKSFTVEEKSGGVFHMTFTGLSTGNTVYINAGQTKETKRTFELKPTPSK